MVFCSGWWVVGVWLLVFGWEVVVAGKVLLRGKFGVSMAALGLYRGEA